MVIRKTNRVIRESNDFLEKLYDAENNNLWYREFPKDEYYTTLQPNYQQILRKRYQKEFKGLMSVERDISTMEKSIGEFERRLKSTLDLNEIDNIVSEKA